MLNATVSTHALHQRRKKLSYTTHMDEGSRVLSILYRSKNNNDNQHCRVEILVFIQRLLQRKHCGIKHLFKILGRKWKTNSLQCSRSKILPSVKENPTCTPKQIDHRVQSYELCYASMPSRKLEQRLCKQHP